MLSGRDTEVGGVDVPESKYSINLSPGEIEQIQTDYDRAFKQFAEEMKKQQVCYLNTIIQVFTDMRRECLTLESSAAA